jgi:phosphopantothenoylcysteine decarboxylase/phosphopantothenate--cysteine ligase
MTLSNHELVTAATTAAATAAMSDVPPVPPVSSAPSAPSAPTVLLGVTGCVAAYKACELVRLLQKAGAHVKVVMTPMAAEFVTPATFKALTREPVALAPVDDATAPVHHISLAREADVFVVAPATANTINKLAHGVADNLLTTTALATGAPLLVAPAMNVQMWRDETTQQSLDCLRARGVAIIEPEAGYLACGEIGEGRLAPVETIAEWVLVELRRSRDLAGKRVLVTAGPTREHLDPVRFLSNSSSGITGYAIAEEAARRGAEVVLVSGPTTLLDPFGCTVVHVTSALEMLGATKKAFDARGFDAAVFTAAIADYRPAECREHKLKKHEQGDELSLRFVANPDILATLAADKGSTFVVGFAAETWDVIAAAQRKLQEKNADLIVANDVSNPALGFASTHNRWHFVTRAGVETTEILHKRTLARLLLNTLAHHSA